MNSIGNHMSEIEIYFDVMTMLAESPDNEITFNEFLEPKYPVTFGEVSKIHAYLTQLANEGHISYYEVSDPDQDIYDVTYISLPWDLKK